MSRFVLALAALAVSTSVLAQTPGAVPTPAPGGAPQVELQAEASREVANDLMNAMLYVEASDTVPAQLANTLTRAMNEALAIGREFKSVRVRSGNMQTFPVYDRTNKLTQWRGRADLRVEGKDFREVAALIARLQPALQLANVGFTVSPDARRQAENELIDEAIAAFRARADIVRQSMKGREAKIRRLAVNAGGEFPGPRPMLAQVRVGVAGAPAVETPSFEGGTSRVQVSVSGVVDIE